MLDCPLMRVDGKGRRARMSPSSSPGRPSAQARAVVATLTVVVLIPLLWLYVSHADYPDYHYWHGAARVWLAGGNPYDVGYPDVLLYPLPAVLAVVPLAGLSMPLACAVFVAISAGLLSYGSTRESWHGLGVLLSAPFIIAAGLGQWSPLLTAAVLLPWLAPLRVLKPSLGLALTVGYPTWGAIAGGPLLLAASLLAMPTWPAEWLESLGAIRGHLAPVLRPGGVFALLALLRWRRPEARLVAAMACVPQHLFFADQLPLWLVARTDGERRTLLWSGLTGLVAAMVFERGTFLAETAWPYALASCYLPALVIVLRRSNEGPAPLWLEQRLARARAPAWVRGRRESRAGGRTP